MAKLYWLSDTEWRRIEPLLPQGRRGAHRVDDSSRAERHRAHASFRRTLALLPRRLRQRLLGHPPRSPASPPLFPQSS